MLCQSMLGERVGDGTQFDHLQEAVSGFGSACKERLAGPGEREAVIRRPIEDLLQAVGRIHGIDAVLPHDEVPLPDIGVRPDYAIAVNGAIIGYIEVKRPGRDLDPDKFTGHDKRQWERLRDLPNLLYTNGTEWRLYQRGELVGSPVGFTGTLASAGTKLRVEDPFAFSTLMKTFLLWTIDQIRHVSTLVQRIAPLCRLLRSAVLEQLAAEQVAAKGGAASREMPFTGLKGDWRRYLFPTADDATFADGYAQTVTFALLLARTENIPLTGSGLHEIGRRLDAGHALMGTALQLLTDNVTERFEVTLDLLARVVESVDWPAIRRGRKDAYLHLYESFLSVYDDRLRQKSGSYYTPREVVEEMVRLTEDVLRTRLGIAAGFASEDVRIVDPAMGTGTFLHTIIERVAERAADEFGPGMQPEAVSRLAKRLYGFELQMGPFAVAELRTSDLMKQYQAAAPRDGLNLFVTDTLDNPHVTEEYIPSTYGAISESRQRANQVKARTPVTAVIANPPYDDKAEGRGGWIEKRDQPGDIPLLDGFRQPGNGRYEHILKNLYIYFWRWATWKVFDADAGQRNGVVCFITPSGFATGPGGRGMREYLRHTCDEGWIINVSPEGHRPDVVTRIFPGVAQPLAICIFVRRTDSAPGSPARIHYRSVHGHRSDKYRGLQEIQLDDDGWRDVHADGSRPFTPTTSSDWDDYPALDDLFPWGSPGVKANRSWVNSPSRDTLCRRWTRLIRESDAREKADLFKATRDRTLDGRYPALPERQARLSPLGAETATSPDLLRVGLRSFDRQWVIADNRVLDRPRPDLWAALQDGQIFLNQQSSHEISSGPAVVASALLPDAHHFNGRGGKVMPILHPDGTANVPAGLLQHLTDALGLEAVAVHDLAAYTAAVAGHPGFTERFTEELLTPGVRLPITRDPALWREAVLVGREVLWASTFGDAYADTPGGRAKGKVQFSRGDPRRIRYETSIGSEVPDRIEHDAATQTLHLGSGVFGPVPEAVWTYDVGGMQVVKKWFGYRKANPSSKKTSPLDDIHVTSWPAEWSIELIELLSVLRRLTDLADQQRDLLKRIIEGTLVTHHDLTTTHILPVGTSARRPRREAESALFDASNLQSGRPVPDS